MHRHALVHVIAEQVASVANGGGRTQGTVEMRTRTCLVPKKMQRAADQPFAHHRGRDGVTVHCDAMKPLGERKRFSIVSVHEARPVKPPEGSQLIIGIAKVFADLEHSQPGRVAFCSSPSGHQTDCGQHREQLHLAAHISGRLWREACQGLLDALAAFLRQG